MGFGWLWCVDVGSSLVKKYTILVSDIDNGGGYACSGPGSIWEITVTSSQFCCNLKLLQEIKSFKKNTNLKEQK